MSGLDDWEQTKAKARMLHPYHESTVSEALTKVSGIQYDKFDAMVTGFTLTSLMFITHPIVFALNIVALGKVTKDSYHRSKNYSDKIDLINRFGFDLTYYLTGMGIATWYFFFIQNYSFEICHAGTFATILAEVILSGC